MGSDPREPIEQAWRQFLAADADRHLHRLNPEAPRFIDYAWEKFDPKTVMSTLISPETAYPALKPILFSGLCTWAVCPTKQSLRQHGMLLVGIEELCAAEAKGRRIFSGRDLPCHELLGDTFGRISILGQNYFNDFYYPILGMQQIMRSTTPGQFRRSIAYHTKSIDIIVSMMQVFDFHAKNLSNSKKYYQASDSKGFELIRKIHGVGRGVIGIDLKKINDVWNSQNRYSAMIYAASTVKAGDTKTLLEVIRSGTVSYEDHGHLLQSWIRRARYVAEIVLHPTTKPELAQSNSAWLPELEGEATPDPILSDAEQSLIEGEFDMISILGNRRPKQRRERLSRRGPRRV